MDNEYEIEKRTRVIEEAKASSLLDAAFYICRFNAKAPFHRAQKIDPLEVVAESDIAAFEEASTKAWNLITMAGDLGAAYYKYPGSEPYEVVEARMRRDHPGFCEDVYGTMFHDGAVSMR
jgi:hypothetical protein